MIEKDLDISLRPGPHQKTIRHCLLKKQYQLNNSGQHLYREIRVSLTQSQIYALKIKFSWSFRLSILQSIWLFLFALLLLTIVVDRA